MKTVRTEIKNELLSKWRESGKSAAEFCREKRIRPTTFYGWIKSEKKKEKSNFVKINRIKLTPEIIENRYFTIEKSGIKITLGKGVEKEELIKVLKALVSI